MPLFCQDFFRYPFLQYAAAAGVLASVACGVVGSYVVVRRATYVAGAVSHCVLGGMGLARYLQKVHGVEWATPLLGAAAAAILAAILIGAVTIRGRERVDTVLSAIWAVGMAVGVSFIAATPGYGDDLMGYLFGNILMVAKGDLHLMLLLNAVVLASVALFYDRFLAISFSPETARLRGIRVEIYELFFLILTALTVVLLVKVVGIVMVIALLTLPAATAGYFTKSLLGMMILGAGLSVVFTIGGLALSYAPDWPAGATIIELAGGAYLLTALWHRLFFRRGPGV